MNDVGEINWFVCLWRQHIISLIYTIRVGFAFTIFFPFLPSFEWNHISLIWLFHLTQHFNLGIIWLMTRVNMVLFILKKKYKAKQTVNLHQNNVIVSRVWILCMVNHWKAQHQEFIYLENNTIFPPENFH